METSSKTVVKQPIRLPFGAAASLIASLHFFGFLGMWWQPMGEWLQKLTPFESFLSLTPLNLLINLVLLLAFHRQFTQRFVLASFLVFLVGYFIEVLGVSTGKVFGVYHYGTVLGYKVLEVPLLIGVNWLILVYCTVAITKKWLQNPWQVAALAAGLMVAMDALIEPVAIHFYFWKWQTEAVPLQNYIAWYLVAFPLCLLMASFPKIEQNRLAPVILVAQLLFFLAHNLLL